MVMITGVATGASYTTWGQTKPFALKVGNKGQWDKRFSPVVQKKEKVANPVSLPQQLMSKSFIQSVSVLKRALNGNAKMRVFRIDGRLVHQMDLNDMYLVQQVQNQLSSGIYFLSLSTDNKLIGSVKLILTK